MRPPWPVGRRGNVRPPPQNSRFPMEQSPRTLHLCPPSAHSAPPARPAPPAPADQRDLVPTSATISPPNRPFHRKIKHFSPKSICYLSATYLLPICYLSATICYHLLPPVTQCDVPTSRPRELFNLWAGSGFAPGRPPPLGRSTSLPKTSVALGGSSCLTRRTGRTGPKTEMLPQSLPSLSVPHAGSTMIMSAWSTVIPITD